MIVTGNELQHLSAVMWKCISVMPKCRKEGEMQCLHEELPTQHCVVWHQAPRAAGDWEAVQSVLGGLLQFLNKHSLFKFLKIHYLLFHSCN